ncbi:carboxypeptidase regulatory-like domain-containing protein [Telmatobacter bradus]|uniref:carboxypeptidase regulatory-like domain-containing protein n=1 Tax=Telmatobacter bradus TaxID=474953 RepID=UPI003B435FDA
MTFGLGSFVPASAQQSASPLPDAPQVQIAMNEQPALPGDSSSALPQEPAAASQTSAPANAPQATTADQHQKAATQLKEEEHQRVLGIVPSFNVSYRGKATAPLSASQKMQLAYHASIDPFAFAGALLMAGYREAMDDDTGFGWGAEGYGKRSGAAYLDTVSSDIIGNGLYPVLLHQDPRFYRLGHGTVIHRAAYAIGTSFVCKGDNGHWQPNISNVAGNITAGAISNLYYPSSDNSGVGQAFSDGMLVTAEGGLGAVFQEFWPDVSRKFLHRDPTHGLDAQAEAEDKAAKDAKNAKANQAVKDAQAAKAK